MLSPRVYKILTFFASQTQPLYISETGFEYKEIMQLKNEGLLCEDSKPYYEFPGAIPYPKNAYAISHKGKDALILHDEEIKRIQEDLRIAKSSRKWAIIAAWVSIASLLATIVSILLPLLLNK